MSENSETHSVQPPFERRRSDQPSNADLAKMLTEIAKDVADANRKLTAITEAFPTNDLGKPDFDGHRRAHVTMIAEAKVMDGYKVEATKKIVGGLAVFLLGLFASGSASALRDWIMAAPK